MSKRPNKAEALVRELRIWGWPLFFKSLGEKAMLFCDEDLLPPLQEITGPLKCRTQSPRTIEDSDRFRKSIQHCHTLIIFTREREFALTTFLRRLLPSRRTFSAQYDLAPVSTRIPIRLPTAPLHTPLPKPLLKPLVLLSTPGSDGEYLAELMARADMPRPVEYIGKPVIEILKQCDRFKPVQYFRSLQRNAMEAGSLAIHLQTDVIDAMETEKALSARRLRWALERTGATVITLTREDKLFQAGLLGMFHDRPFRSVWTIPSGRKKGFPGTIRSSFEDSYQCFIDLEQMEKKLTSLLAGYNRHLTLTTEELVSDPHATLAKIAELTEKPLTGTIEIPDYVKGYSNFEKMIDRISDFRRELIDRTGLQLVSHTSRQVND